MLTYQMSRISSLSEAVLACINRGGDFPDRTRTYRWTRVHSLPVVSIGQSPIEGVTPRVLHLFQFSFQRQQYVSLPPYAIP